jgi:prophage regulatory protein
MQIETSTAFRIISLLEAAKRLNLGRSTLYASLDKKSAYYKNDLPQPVRQGSSVGFIEHEIDDYIRGLMQARGGDVGR